MKFTTSYLTILILALILGICATILTKKSDSPLEQAAEAILQSQGIDIDFSPDDTE